MNVREYQEAAKTTAIYPSSASIYYPAFGLVGEVGELNEKRETLMIPNFVRREDGGIQDIGHVGIEDIIDETGDCLWYMANLCSDLGLLLESVLGLPNGGFFHDQIPVEAVNPIIALGQIAEAAKKHIRDGKLNLDKIIKGLQRIYVYLLWIAETYQFALDEAAERNIAKLASRKERGVLQGDGDKR